MKGHTQLQARMLWHPIVRQITVSGSCLRGLWALPYAGEELGGVAERAKADVL